MEQGSFVGYGVYDVFLTFITAFRRHSANRAHLLVALHHFNYEDLMINIIFPEQSEPCNIRHVQITLEVVKIQEVSPQTSISKEL